MLPEPTITSPAEVGATRAVIIGNRKTTAEIAHALGCCERSVVNIINEQHVPYIKFLGRRYVEPAAVAAALLNREHNKAPRKAGRPSKKVA